MSSIEKRRKNVPRHLVTKSDASKSGAPRVYFDNKHDWADAFYVSKKIEAPVVGRTIDAETASSNFQGKTYWYLNSWKPVEMPVAQISPMVNPPGPSPAVTYQVHQEPSKPPSGWPIEAGDCSRFVSNVLGSAIAAGLVKRPTDIHPWVATAYTALQGLRAGKPVDFDDAMRLPDPVEPGGYDDEEGSGRFDGDPGPEVPF
jgi:hypothetical protein